MNQGRHHYNGERKKRFLHRMQKRNRIYPAKKRHKKTIKDTDYTFRITVAICDECGEEMSIPGLIDKNIREVDEQYLASEAF